MSIKDDLEALKKEQERIADEARLLHEREHGEDHVRDVGELARKQADEVITNPDDFYLVRELLERQAKETEELMDALFGPPEARD